MVETEEIKTGLKLLEDKKYEEVIKLFDNLLCSFTQSKNDEYISELIFESFIELIYE